MLLIRERLVSRKTLQMSRIIYLSTNLQMSHSIWSVQVHKESTQMRTEIKRIYSRNETLNNIAERKKVQSTIYNPYRLSIRIVYATKKVEI